MIDQTKSFDAILNLQVEHHDESEIRIRVSSVVEADLDTIPSPYPAAMKNFRLILDDGMIALKPLPLGQTSFSFNAIAKLWEAEDKIADSGVSKTSSVRLSSLKRLTTSMGFGSTNGGLGFGETVKAEVRRSEE